MASTRFPFKDLLLIVQISLSQSDDLVAKGGSDLFQGLVTSLTVIFVSWKTQVVVSTSKAYTSGGPMVIGRR